MQHEVIWRQRTIHLRELYLAACFRKDQNMLYTALIATNKFDLWTLVDTYPRSWWMLCGREVVVSSSRGVHSIWFYFQG